MITPGISRRHGPPGRQRLDTVVSDIPSATSIARGAIPPGNILDSASCGNKRLCGTQVIVQLGTDTVLSQCGHLEFWIIDGAWPSGPAPEAATEATKDAELARLRKEVTELKREREILC